MEKQQQDLMIALLRRLDDLPERLVAVLSKPAPGGGESDDTAGQRPAMLDRLERFANAAGRFVPAVGQVGAAIGDAKAFAKAWGDLLEGFKTTTTTQTQPPARQGQAGGPPSPPAPPAALLPLNAVWTTPPPASWPGGQADPARANNMPGQQGVQAAPSWPGGMPGFSVPPPPPSGIFGGGRQQVEAPAGVPSPSRGDGDLMTAIEELTAAVKDLTERVEKLDRDDGPDGSDDAERDMGEPTRPTVTWRQGRPTATGEESSGPRDGDRNTVKVPHEGFRPQQPAPDGQSDLKNLLEIAKLLA